MSSVQQFAVLLVCTANECRSPYATARLSEQPIAAGWRLLSAGTEVIDGTGPCEETALANSYHRSQSLTRELIASVDLVVGLERMHRTRAAELLPAARSKAFTLSEAVRFSQIIANGLEAGERQGDFQVMLPTDWSQLKQVEKLKWLVGEMHEARHFFDPEPGDIADAHGDNGATHERVLGEMTAGVEQFAQAVTRVLAFGGRGS